MCGIAGIVDKAGVNEDLLRKMSDDLLHRGPDDSGVWIDETRRIGLAHRRLSIVDLSAAGKQPMSDDSGKITISFNGEIYNYKSIREELEVKGYKFSSNTDTEVILNSYKEWSFNCLEKLNGMFAFAIYDARNRNLFLARDRVGKKPLYFTRLNDRLVFSSELKAIIRDPKVPKEIDFQALNYYLAFGYIGSNLSIYDSIHKLPPAHALVYKVDTSEINIYQYWDLPHTNIPDDVTEEQLEHELEGILKDAVKIRMISDVPLGAFLSGGVDSSLIVALMAQISPAPVKTFSIGFEENKFNELPYARVVANHFQTDHHEILVKPDAFGILPDLVKQFDEPFADSSMIPTYYVSKKTRESVTVALSGDGGDELFGGYSHYFATLANYQITKFVPELIRRNIASISEFLPDTTPGKRQLLRLKYDANRAFIDRITHPYFKINSRQDLLKQNVLSELGVSLGKPEYERLRILEGNSLDFVNRLGATDFKTYLPDDILVKVDRASMYVSLEVRAPILDYRIVEFAFSKVPGDIKIKGRNSKYLLKKLAKKLLPPALNINRKWGFAIPIADWFRGPLYNEVRGILLDGLNEWVKSDYIEKLFQQHRAGIDHSGRLYSLLVLALWKDGHNRTL